jgi:ketosteroid isomerase-like protein
VASQSVDILLRAIAAWNRADFDAALADVHPDVEWELARLLPDTDGVYRGHEGVREFWRVFTGAWERISFEPDGPLHEIGDDLVLPVRFRATGRDSGMEIDGRFVHRYTFRDGRLRRFKVYVELDEALADASGA